MWLACFVYVNMATHVSFCRSTGEDKGYILHMSSPIPNVTIHIDGVKELRLTIANECRARSIRDDWEQDVGVPIDTYRSGRSTEEFRQLAKQARAHLETLTHVTQTARRIIPQPAPNPPASYKCVWLDEAAKVWKDLLADADAPLTALEKSLFKGLLDGTFRFPATQLLTYSARDDAGSDVWWIGHVRPDRNKGARLVCKPHDMAAEYLVVYHAFGDGDYDLYEEWWASVRR
jgi:hypothetical protein